MNIPDEMLEQAEALWWDISGDHQSVEALQLVAEWARKEALREAAALVKAEIERLELVKGTYAKAQRHSLGLIWAHLRSAALSEGATS